MIEKPKINRDPIQIKRALISVYDKTDIFDLAKVLHDNQIEILSTGGTSIALRENNIPVQDVSDYTNFPEIMDGRVKTINPLVEGGILGLRDIHEDDAKSNSIKWIDLVICNLYPFSETINKLVIFFSFIIAKAFEAGIFSFTTNGFFDIKLFRFLFLEKFFNSLLRSPSVTIPLIYFFLRITTIPSFF